MYKKISIYIIVFLLLLCGCTNKQHAIEKFLSLSNKDDVRKNFEIEEMNDDEDLAENINIGGIMFKTTFDYDENNNLNGKSFMVYTMNPSTEDEFKKIVDYIKKFDPNPLAEKIDSVIWSVDEKYIISVDIIDGTIVIHILNKQ